MSPERRTAAVLAVSDMRDNLQYADLGTDLSATRVSCGMGFVCAPLDTGARKCWGDGGWEQLGLGRQDVLGDGRNEMGDDLPVVVFFDP